MTMIEWAHVAHSVIRGCSRASTGCDNCYSARLDGTRLAHLEAVPGVRMGDLVTLTGKGRYAYNGRVMLDHAALAKALKLPRSRGSEQRRVFWNHRSDTFHERLTNEEIAAQFGVMAARPDLTFLVLTKRARRMREFFEWVVRREADGRAIFPDDDPSWRIGQMLQHYAGKYGAGHQPERPTARNGYEPFDPRCQPWPLPNVGLGVSVETPEYYDRIEDLRQTPAARRLLSLEPALAKYKDLPLDGIHWVIVGAESGPGARPAPLEWVRSVRDEVLAARVMCRSCHGEGRIRSGEFADTCPTCDGHGWSGPALFIKQWDVCEACTGDGMLWPYDMVSSPCWVCSEKGQTGKVRKGNPAIDGRVWAEVPR
jgi:protein gp37